MPVGERGSRLGRGGKTLMRKFNPRGRLLVRSNSMGALSCGREASVATTVGLCLACRLPVADPCLPVVDTATSRKLVEFSNLPQTDASSLRSPLIDLPTKMVKICGADRWEFDVFTFKRQSSSGLVCSLGLHFCERHNLFKTLRLDRLTLIRTLAAIESVYWQHNPYHTALHASDVTQALHCFISQPKLLRLLSPAELFGSIMAAFCHDADHPGTNQSFLEQTENFLVQLYNSTSVLEQHHARVGLTILHQTGLAKNLTQADWITVRECILKMVHATDVSQQAFYKDKFSRFLEAKRAQPLPSFSAEDRILLLQVSLKCADVSNPCRPWQSCRQWAHKICEEFFSQGDQERHRLSLTPVKGCDRYSSSVPAIQIGFIEHFVRPLFVNWNEFFQTELTQKLMRNLEQNLSMWQKQLLLINKPKTTHSSSCSVVAPLRPSLEPQVEKKQRKVLKEKGSPKKKTTESKSQSHNVTFHLGNLLKSFQSTSGRDIAPGSGCQTFFITTRGMRRRSLPETQGAIKKTFNFARSKISGPLSVSTAKSSSFTYPVTATSSPPTVHYVYVNKPDVRSLRTTSVNILQTLCEEIMSHEPLSKKSRGFELDPFPLPDAWNVAGNGVNRSSNLPSYMTGLSIDLSVTDFVALAHRRSSVPLVEK